MPSVAQAEENSNKFYYSSASPCDWSKVQKDDLWNSGTEDNPVKTEYDPCPEGWRVPTYAELNRLNNSYSSFMTVGGQKGYYFCGDYTYLDNAPQVFFPAAGYRGTNNGNASARGMYGYYWSSRPYSSGAYFLSLDSSNVNFGSSRRAGGYSVRCVQVTD
jgi:uncharacterized protein (TIGR02145 family)